MCIKMATDFSFKLGFSFLLTNFATSTFLEGVVDGGGPYPKGPIDAFRDKLSLSLEGSSNRPFLKRLSC